MYSLKKTYTVRRVFSYLRKVCIIVCKKNPNTKTKNTWKVQSALIDNDATMLPPSRAIIFYLPPPDDGNIVAEKGAFSFGVGFYTS